MPEPGLTAGLLLGRFLLSAGFFKRHYTFAFKRHEDICGGVLPQDTKKFVSWAQHSIVSVLQ